MTNYTTLNDRPLQDFYSIDIEKSGSGEAFIVYFNSKIHVEKRVLMPVSYCTSSFAHHEILRDRDLLRGVLERYRNVYQCACR